MNKKILVIEDDLDMSGILEDQLKDAGYTVTLANNGADGLKIAEKQEHDLIVLDLMMPKMDGYQVMPMLKAAKLGDFFCTVPGDIRVLRKEHFAVMKDGAVIYNSGHFNVEIDLESLVEMSEGKRQIRENVEEYHLSNGKRVNVLGEGRLVNLAAAEGHPSSVMDMSFATQALTTEYAMTRDLSAEVYEVPDEIEDWISIAKLEAMGIYIDELTEEQKEYLASWEMGT